MSADTRIRYVARWHSLGPRSETVGIYDRERGSWPILHAGVRVPQRFPSEDAAQAWADEHLNAAAVPAVPVLPSPARQVTRKRAS